MSVLLFLFSSCGCFLGREYRHLVLQIVWEKVWFLAPLPDLPGPISSFTLSQDSSRIWAVKIQDFAVISVQRESRPWVPHTKWSFPPMKIRFSKHKKTFIRSNHQDSFYPIPKSCLSFFLPTLCLVLTVRFHPSSSWPKTPLELPRELIFLWIRMPVAWVVRLRSRWVMKLAW